VTGNDLCAAGSAAQANLNLTAARSGRPGQWQMPDGPGDCPQPYRWSSAILVPHVSLTSRVWKSQVGSLPLSRSAGGWVEQRAAQILQQLQPVGGHAQPAPVG
jgi:hypothetical protein